MYKTDTDTNTQGTRHKHAHTCRKRNFHWSWNSWILVRKPTSAGTVREQGYRSWRGLSRAPQLLYPYKLNDITIEFLQRLAHWRGLFSGPTFQNTKTPHAYLCWWQRLGRSDGGWAPLFLGPVGAYSSTSCRCCSCCSCCSGADWHAKGRDTCLTELPYLAWSRMTCLHAWKHKCAYTQTYKVM